MNGVKPKGNIKVDEGAKEALLKKNKSLLPSGVKNIIGVWSKGDIVQVVDSQEHEIAKGISNFSSMELDRIKGVKTNLISEILGYEAPDEVIHKDNMVKID